MATTTVVSRKPSGKTRINRKGYIETFISESIKVSTFKYNWLKKILKKAGDEVIEQTKVDEIETCPVTTFPETLMDLPSIPDELEKELAVVCSIDSLHCNGESPTYEYHDFRVLSDNPLENIPKDVDLATLRFQKQDLIKRWKNKPYRRLKQKRRTEVKLDPLLIRELTTSDPTAGLEGEIIPVTTGEVVLTVLICLPSRRYCRRDLIRGGVTYLVLGSQKLTKLRDKINCIADNMIPGNFIFNPKVNVEKETKTKDLYKSGFFFINNTFYNDMRDPLNRDYSDTIISWATSKSRCMGPYETKIMEEAKFQDLEIELGHPYIYCHQGSCEHLVVFQDIRLIHAKDCQNRLQYPLCCGTRKRKRTICMTCHSRTSKWIVENNHRLPTYPFFFCDICFHEFNYDPEGKPIGDFIAHPYTDQVSIT